MITESSLFWLFLNLITIIILAFFSMTEMACVSFNKVRLQFYVSQGNRNAIRLNHLLQNPSQLFGTTLIGVNVATFVGSECARRFYEALGLTPDIAPLTQVFLVIIFGELAPMFAARFYAENVALMGISLLSFASKILSPFIWILGVISKAANLLLGGKEPHPHLFLTQDELQKILEEQEDEGQASRESVEFNAVTTNIFRLRNKHVRHVMSPLSQDFLVSSQTSIKQLRQQQAFQEKNYLILYSRAPDNIVGIVYVKDLLRAQENKKLYAFSRPPWFVSATTSLIQILKQFRRNTENIAIVLNEGGQAIGFVTFEDILDEIFEKPPLARIPRLTIVERTLSADMTLDAFHKEMGFELAGDPGETLSSWLIRMMEHHPEEGESFIVPPYEFVVKETTLLGITTVQVKTIVE
jgi:CBS domain containing-hemolysin-like protein